MREIKIFRQDVGVVTDALQWSDDGQLAMNAGQFATILTPAAADDETDSDKADSYYTQRQTPQIEPWITYLEWEGGFANDEEFSQTCYASDNSVTDMVWSPTGATARRGCLFALLTTRGEVFIYEPLGHPAFAEWQLKYHINRQMIEDCKIEVPVKRENAKELRFHSLVWTSVYPWSGSKWGTSFVICGTELGTLVVYQHDDEGLRFCAKYPSGLEDGAWVVQALVSKKVNEDSLLALVGSNNQIMVHKLVYDSENMKLVLKDGFQLASPSRIRISKLQWFQHNDVNLLGAYQNGSLNVYLFDSQLNCQSILKVPTEWKCECSGMVMYPNGDDNIKVVATSNKGHVLAAEVNVAAGSATPVNETTLTNFISKRCQVADDGQGLDFRLFSVTPHPHGTYMAILYSAYQGRKLRYPVMHEQIKRIAFLPTKSVELPAVWSVLTGSSLCSWWEFNVLFKAVPPSNRDQFKQRWINYLEESIPEAEDRQDASDNLGTDLEQMLLRSNVLDRVRLLQHYGQDRHMRVLEALATTTLKFVHRLGDLELTDLDKAVLQSYSHFTAEPAVLAYTPEDSHPISLSGGFFEEVFDFSRPCNEYSIQSQSEHAWPRCSITLLPLLSVNVLTCQGCGRKAISNSALPAKSKLVEVILDTLDVCIYCGGRYYERK